MALRTIALNKLGFGKPMRLSHYIARKHKSRTTVALEGEGVKAGNTLCSTADKGKRRTDDA
jgi:hypothetical protein